MKLWLTPAEIAELALPGLPTTKRGVQIVAEREDWARFVGMCRPRAGRGGGVEYHVNLLPVAARTARTTSPLASASCPKAIPPCLTLGQPLPSRPLGAGATPRCSWMRGWRCSAP